ncbi:hypothetical protein BDQ17DRAFT_1423223 [Cyathus striatus]|nr:hypothetical protein BDQ17DRAFT_1423223 [Cyathus striatus]
MTKKHYIPLESDPEVFTHLLRSLGVSNLAFTDVLSLDDPDLLSMVPRPVYGLVLVFPTVSKEWEAFIAAREGAREEYTGSGEGEEVVWFKQTIGNACGLYAVLHAVCNGEARGFIQPNTPLSNLLSKIVPLPPAQRAQALEEDEEIEKAHHAAAVQGSSVVPDAEIPVNYHYIAFVKSKNGHLYDLNGDLKGPVDLGVVSVGDGKGDVFDAARSVVKEYVGREEGNVHFSLMALVPGDD